MVRAVELQMANGRKFKRLLRLIYPLEGSDVVEKIVDENNDEDELEVKVIVDKNKRIKRKAAIKANERIKISNN